MTENNIQLGENNLKEEKKGAVDQNNKRFLSENLEVIEKNLDQQPKSVQDLFGKMKDNFIRKEVIDGKNFIFSGVQNKFALALVEDDTKKGIYKTRVFRFSGSDHQWKPLPGLRKNGDYKKGDEENKDHHYVQSAKLHKDVYKIINQLPFSNDIDINFQDFLPQENNNYENEELDFKEKHVEFNDKKWENSKNICQYLYKIYSYLVASSLRKEDFSLDGGLYKSLKIFEEFCKRNKFSFGKNISNLIKDIEEMNDDPKNAEELKETKMKDLVKNYHRQDGDENLNKLLNSYHGHVSKFVEEMFTCKSKKIFPETMMPDFSQDHCIDRYTKKDIEGNNDINIEEYKVKSPSGDELVFAMAYDNKGRVYIDNVYNPNSKVSSYGTLDKITQMGHLVYKPEDYDKQATIGFPNNYKKIVDYSSYCDISKLWENIPVISRFKNELISRGIVKEVNKKSENISITSESTESTGEEQKINNIKNMSKEKNINLGEANEHKKTSPETGPEQPATPEDVQKAIKAKAEASVKKIDSGVVEQKDLENEASGGEVIPGAKKVDEKRDAIVETSKKGIKKIANPYAQFSSEELNNKWSETKKLLDEAEKNKDEAAYNENYQKIKEIEAAQGWLKDNPYVQFSAEELNNKWSETKKLLDDAEKNKDEKAYEDNYKIIKEIEDAKKWLEDNPYARLSKEELNNKWSETKKLLDEAEKNKDEAAYNEHYQKIKEIEKVRGENYEPKEMKKTEEKEDEEPEAEKEDVEEVKEKLRISEEVAKAAQELGLKSEDLEKMETFVNLSEGAQILALKNYNQILVDEAIKVTPEKIAQIKQARKDRYQEKMGKKKGAFMAGIRNFFGSGKTKDKGFDQAYEEIKDKEYKKNKELALKAAVNWVANFDVPAKLEDGKVKLEFVDGSKFDKETQAVVEELNEAANKFARMPQYMSNISASKKDKAKYEKAQLAMRNKKEELEASLSGKKREEEIISILTSIDNKVSNLQNNLTDEERAEFEKSDSWLMRQLKSKGMEKTSYFVGGSAARAIIRNKLASDTTENLANAGANATMGLASAGVLAFSAVIGGVRAWHREKKKIREEDKKIGKQEYQESEEMKNRKEALKALKDVTPDFLKLFKERKEPQEGERWENYQNRTITQWLKEDPEKAKIYLAKKDEFDQANAEFLKTQKKKFLEFKTEANFIYAESAKKKIEKLVNDINKLNDKEDLSSEEKDKLIKKIEMLKTRLDYTQGKIDDGLLALGLKEKRLTNSTELFNTISQASLLVESIDYQNENLPKKVSDIIGDEFRNDDGTINMKAWLESASEEELFLYRKTRIKTFLEGLDNTVTNERTKQKIKKATIGAISGGVLSFAGMKTFDYLGDTEAGQAVKEKIGEGLNYIANTEAGEQIGSGISAIQEKINDAINYGVDQGETALADIRNIFGIAPSESLEDLMPSADEVDAISGAAEGTYVVPESSPEFVGPVEPEVLDDVVKSFDELKESGALTKVISNEGLKEGQTDSIWRSARKLFTDNAESLGYEGDLDDAGAVRKWADNMTANAINRMDDVTDKVFEGVVGPDGEKSLGNEIILNKNEAGEYIIEVEQGEGLKPGYLSKEEVSEISGDRAEPMEKMPRREINEIPHTRELPDTETPDDNVTLDDLKDTSEEKTEVESGGRPHEEPMKKMPTIQQTYEFSKGSNPGKIVEIVKITSGDGQVETMSLEDYSKIVNDNPSSGVQEAFDRAKEIREAAETESVESAVEHQNEVNDNNSNQESYSDLVQNIDQEGGERSAVQEALDRAREAREASDKEFMDSMFRGGEVSGTSTEGESVELPEVKPEEPPLSDLVSSIDEEGGLKSGAEESLDRAREGLGNDNKYTGYSSIDKDGEMIEESWGFDATISPELSNATKEMSNKFVHIFTEEAKKIPSDFFRNPNDIYKIRGLGETSFAEQFENITKFDFNDMELLDQVRVVKWFNGTSERIMQSDRGIRELNNVILAPLRLKYDF